MGILLWTVCKINIYRSLTRPNSIISTLNGRNPLHSYGWLGIQRKYIISFRQKWCSKICILTLGWTLLRAKIENNLSEYWYSSIISYIACIRYIFKIRLNGTYHASSSHSVIANPGRTTLFNGNKVICYKRHQASLQQNTKTQPFLWWKGNILGEVGQCYGCWFADFLSRGYMWPLLLTWINFNPGTDK